MFWTRCSSFTAISASFPLQKEKRKNNQQNIEYAKTSEALPDNQTERIELEPCQRTEQSTREEMMLMSELKSLHFWASALVEFLATFFFIFLTTGTTITWNELHPPSTELISLSFGFSIATLAMCSLHLSGGHINPAVSIAMMAIRKVTVLRGITYVIFQLAGGKGSVKDVIITLWIIL